MTRIARRLALAVLATVVATASASSARAQSASPEAREAGRAVPADCRRRYPTASGSS